MVEDWNDLYVPERLAVECDPPQGPIADDFGWQASEPHGRNWLRCHDSGQPLDKTTNAVVPEADVLQPEVLRLRAVQRNPLHLAAVRPFQAISEEVPVDFAFITAKVRRGHPLNPKLQRMATQLLGKRWVKHRFVVKRPASRFLLGLSPD